MYAYFRVSALKELCCPGGRAFARSGAQRTHRAAKDAAQMPALHSTGLRDNTVPSELDTGKWGIITCRKGGDKVIVILL